jgi:hypothetical protein
MLSEKSPPPRFARRAESGSGNAAGTSVRRHCRTPLCNHRPAKQNNQERSGRENDKYKQRDYSAKA